MLLWIHHFTCAQLFLGWLELWHLLPPLFHQIKSDQGEESEGGGVMRFQVLILPFCSPRAFWLQCHHSRFWQNPSRSLLPTELGLQRLESWRSRAGTWERRRAELQHRQHGSVRSHPRALPGSLPSDRWQKTKSCHRVEGMWLTLNGIT